MLNEVDRQSFEQEKPQPTGEIIILNPVASMFFNRLIEQTQLLTKIDSPNFPCRYYGEIPIYPDHNQRKGHLRWGVLRAIEDSFDTLTDLGFGLEAKAVLEIQNNG